MLTEKQKQVHECIDFIKEHIKDENVGMIFIPFVRDIRKKECRNLDEFSTGILTNIGDQKTFIGAICTAFVSLCKDKNWAKDGDGDIYEQAFKLSSNIWASLAGMTDTPTKNRLIATTCTAEHEGNYSINIEVGKDAMKKYDKDGEVDLYDAGVCGNIYDYKVFAMTLGAAVLSICARNHWDIETVANALYHKIMTTDVTSTEDD